MFDRLFADSRGRARILDWFCPHAIAYMSDTVSNEMDMLKEALRGTLDSVTPEFLSTWDLDHAKCCCAKITCEHIQHVQGCIVDSLDECVMIHQFCSRKTCRVTAIVNIISFILFSIWHVKKAWFSHWSEVTLL